MAKGSWGSRENNLTISLDTQRDKGYNLKRINRATALPPWKSAWPEPRKWLEAIFVAVKTKPRRKYMARHKVHGGGKKHLKKAKGGRKRHHGGKKLKMKA